MVWYGMVFIFRTDYTIKSLAREEIYIITRKGWGPRTGKGQQLMGILAVTGYGSV